MSRARSSGVRRLLQEAAELQQDECKDYTAAPLEDDLFQWHFTIKGPGAEFEGGVYHGRIILPSEYPFKPPEIYLSTPSGRFEVNKKICLSISSFHPESWQPSWGIRTALLALSAFFTTEAAGAVGSLDAPPAERRRLAKLSRSYVCATCGFDASKFLDTADRPVETTELEQSPTTRAEDVTPPPSRPVGTALFPPPPRPPVLAQPGPPPAHQHHKVEPTPASRHTAHHHHTVDGGPGAGAGPAVAAPQLPVVQHDQVVAPTPLPVAAGDASLSGGEPLLVDRLILCVLLALVACIVRKFA